MNAPNIKFENLRRVAIVGTSCSGKTTFASNLASVLNVKYIELDAINWLPDWVARPPDEFASLVEAEIANEDWILDGNYKRVRQKVWERATTIIWLNYSFPRTFYRALSRTTRRVVKGEILYSGNRESLRIALFSQDSILLWVLQTYHRRRREYAKTMREIDDGRKEIFIFRHPNQAQEFLQQVKQIRD